MKEYNRYVLAARRSIVDILTEHPTCKPPIDLLLEMLPRLQVSGGCNSVTAKIAVNLIVAANPSCTNKLSGNAQAMDDECGNMVACITLTFPACRHAITPSRRRREMIRIASR